MSFACRCTKHRTCGKRVKLAMHPNSYVRYPRCPVPGCGGHLNFIDSNRTYDKARTCYCENIRYPHRKGAFINENEICTHAEVDDTTGVPVPVVSMRPDDDCPF